MSIFLEKVLPLTVGVNQDCGIGENASAVKIISMCLLCCLNEISLVLLKHLNEFSPDDEIYTSLAHESEM